MKRPLFPSLPLIKNAVCLLAAGIGFVSYVTLVSLLTQKNLSIHRSPPALAAEGRNSFGSLREAQQADFVAKIIQLHSASNEASRHLAEVIVKESSRAHVDPLFVAAIIRSESMFRQHATSSRGAKGLMQLMPATGRYVSQRENIPLKRAEDLQDPSTNIQIGIAYVKYLERKFNGDRKRALIAYNWGPANLTKSLLRSSPPPQDSLAYAHTILSVHREWSQKFTEYALNVDAGAKTLFG